MFRVLGSMIIEIARLFVGLSLALFCRPIAGMIMQRERALDSYFRRRGVHLPEPISDTTAQNLYFFLGIAICLLEAARIWTMLPS